MTGVIMVINRFHPVIGGNETQCKLLSEELASRGVQVSVVTTCLRSARFREDVNGVRVYRILPPVWPNRFWPTVFLSNTVLILFLLLKRRQYDIIHVHQFLWHALGAVIAGRFIKKKTVVKVAGGGPFGNVDFWVRKRYAGAKAMMLLKKADRIVALSDEIIKELAAVGINRNVISIVNGVQLQINPGFEADAAMSAIKMRSSSVALFIGRFVEEKGMEKSGDGGAASHSCHHRRWAEERRPCAVCEYECYEWAGGVLW